MAVNLQALKRLGLFDIGAIETEEPLAPGIQIVYIACPLCGFSRPLKRPGTGKYQRRPLRTPIKAPKSEDISFDLVDLNNGRIVQRRTVNDRGRRGFFIVNEETDCDNFRAFIEKYPHLAEQIRKQAKAILSFF